MLRSYTAEQIRAELRAEVVQTKALTRDLVQEICTHPYYAKGLRQRRMR
jgi:hypothetical protein